MNQRLRILYVDDTPLQIELFRSSLADGEYEVHTARSALEAQMLAGKLQFQLIVLDFHLGDTTAEPLLRALRLQQPEARFFLYTSDATAFRRHRELGFDGVFMLKGKTPVRAQVDVVARAIAKAKPS